ncbi:hypothetical protein ACWT_5181 [Actinoplanes sp. SE50]|uniref:hypothetical protein n=1 Tax=unclassified Actinoplanes TaxID=2626549 RepID=UPI00023ED658|nr:MULTISPECIES: hypothetical protein [unclassified Actinoplanes]AEV86198.1 hypothetical protein ACPL_5311 [Actinoplanes sp. SE50/110]ATO84596.1 hypothetical protein ACWT_5181 [Actinoplanes sp. SE50]SLM02006.1 hypothetical protein ACSP50_5244 [Actinoplanes sp. SE50/110]
MRVEVMPVVPDELRDGAWDFYRESFADLAVLAVHRHVLHREEFDELMADERAPKYVAYDAEDRVAGMASMTTELDAVSLISPDYFRHHWPELYAQRRIFYVLFVGAARGARGAGVFVALLRRLYAPIAEVDGKVFVDICTYNEERHQLPRMIGVILGRVSGKAVPTRLDAQSFWLYEFPGNGLPESV